jgi:hypothetical protein
MPHSKGQKEQSRSTALLRSSAVRRVVDARVLKARVAEELGGDDHVGAATDAREQLRESQRARGQRFELSASFGSFLGEKLTSELRDTKSGSAIQASGHTSRRGAAAVLAARCSP